MARQNEKVLNLRNVGLQLQVYTLFYYVIVYLCTVNCCMMFNISPDLWVRPLLLFKLLNLRGYRNTNKNSHKPNKEKCYFFLFFFLMPHFWHFYSKFYFTFRDLFSRYHNQAGAMPSGFIPDVEKPVALNCCKWLFHQVLVVDCVHHISTKGDALWSPHCRCSKPCCFKLLPEVPLDGHMLVFTGKTLPCTGRNERCWYHTLVKIYSVLF